MPDEEPQRAWAELLQLVPVITLALPFILEGNVDLRRVAGGFLLAAVLTLPVSLFVRHRGQLLNPILIGTAIWLWAGAVAFNVPIEGLGRWLSETQALGLFVAALLVGAVTTWSSPTGYIACRSNDPRWIRRASYALLGLNALLVVWAWFFRHDVRIGGGVPFIVLNLARRLIGRRAP